MSGPRVDPTGLVSPGLACGAAASVLGGIEVDVTFDTASTEASTTPIDAEYHAKYDRYGPGPSATRHRHRRAIP